MVFDIGHSSLSLVLSLVNPAEDCGNPQIDRYVLQMVQYSQNQYGQYICLVQARIFYPHETISLNGKEVLAGTLVLEWLNGVSRDDGKVEAVRSFFGWGSCELSANQKLFVADAENQGFEVEYDYVPENSFGLVCPSFYVDYVYDVNMDADCEVDAAMNVIFARY